MHKEGLSRVNILGVEIDKITLPQLLKEISDVIDSNGCEYIVTPYSEFFYRATLDKEFKDVLNNAYLSIPDGIFTIWASKFLSLSITWPKPFNKLQIILQYIFTGASLLFNRKYVYTEISERIPGSQAIYPICEMAAKRGYKVAILGGFDFGKGNTGILAANKLREKYKGLQIVEIYPGERKVEEEGEIVVDILRKSGADILFCCYAPVKQEKWLANNLKKANINIGLGLGGTLDYVSGAKRTAPEFFTKFGLEWLIRPVWVEGSSLKRVFLRAKRAWWQGFILSSTLVLKQKLKDNL